MAAGPDRDRALDLALAQIDKQFGKGSVMRLGERPVIQTSIRFSGTGRIPPARREGLSL